MMVVSVTIREEAVMRLHERPLYLCVPLKRHWIVVFCPGLWHMVRRTKRDNGWLDMESSIPSQVTTILQGTPHVTIGMGNPLHFSRKRWSVCSMKQRAQIGAGGWRIVAQTSLISANLR